MHERLERLLLDWNFPRDAIEELLWHAVFGPGLTGLEPTDPSIALGVSIVVDAQRDESIAKLFQLRRELDDESFLSCWQPAPTPRIQLVVCPYAPEELIACTIEIVRPTEFTRTFLLLASNRRRSSSGFST